MKRGRLDELEGFRGLMAWWVVLGHLAFVFSDRAGDLSHNRSAVMGFIALSGFVITGLLNRGEENYAAFLTRRVFRLWPVYLLALILSAATLTWQRQGLVDAPFHPGRSLFRIAEIDQAMSHLGAQFLAHAVMLHGLVPQKLLPGVDLAIMGQAWSLSVELQYYLIAPAFVALIRRGRLGVALAVVAAVGLYALHWAPWLRGNTAFIAVYTPWFAVGMATFYLSRWQDRRRAAWAAGAMAVMLLGVTLVFREPGALAWILVLWLLIRPGWLNHALAHPILRRIGEASYSTYVFHMLVIMLGAYALNFLHMPRGVYAIALSAGTVVVTLGLSLFTFKYVEKRANDAGYRLSRKYFGPQPHQADLLTAP